MPTPQRHPAACLAPALAASIVMLGACAEPGPTAPAPSAGAPALAVSATANPPAAAGVYRFSGCVGPAGTPPSFRAQKTVLPAAARNEVAYASAFRLTDGGGVFVVLSFGEGRFSPPGIASAGIATVTCQVETSLGTLQYSGFLTRGA